MELAFRYLKMAHNIKDNLNLIKQMEKVNLFFKMEMFIKDNGNKIKFVVKENLFRNNNSFEWIKILRIIFK